MIRSITTHSANLRLRMGLAALVILAFLAGCIFSCAVTAHGLTYDAAKRMSPAKVRRVVIKVAKRHHLPRDDRRALITLFREESRLRAVAHSRGWKHLGVGQLAGIRRSDRRWFDPAWNTARAIRYIRHRYGNARAALAHKHGHGWY